MENKAFVTGGDGSKQPVVIHQINIQSANRQTLEIQDFINRRRAAESVTFPNRANLYDIYSDILLDGHLFGIFEKRVAQVQNKTIEYYDKSGKKVDAMDNVICSNAFRGIVRKIVETRAWGISGVEFIPGENLAFAEIPRKHIKPERGIISFNQSTIDTGIPYADEPFVWIIDHGDLGFLLNCAPLVIYKRGNLGDWAQYIELYGQPVRVARYDGHDPQIKAELKNALDEAGSALAMMIPKQAEFTVQDGKQTNGDGQLQERFMANINQELSIIVLGNTETTTNGKTGSQAKSKVHSEQQQELVRSDIHYVTNTLNDPKFLKIIRSYLGSAMPEGGRFAFTKEFDVAHLSQRIEVDKTIAEQVPISDDYFYETYGIPKPDNYDELKKEKEEAAPKPKGKKPDMPQDPEDDDTEDLNSMKYRWKVLRKALSYFFD